MKKINAFTLMELLVGMIVSGLLISMAYMGYFVVYKQYNMYKANREEITGVIQFKTVMQNDFHNADEVIKETGSKVVLKNTPTIEPIQYTFGAAYVTRSKGGLVDTFDIATINRSFTSLYKQNGESLNLINEVSFDADVLGGKEHFVFTKQYAADIIMNYNTVGR